MNLGNVIRIIQAEPLTFPLPEKINIPTSFPSVDPDGIPDPAPMKVPAKVPVQEPADV